MTAKDKALNLCALILSITGAGMFLTAVIIHLFFHVHYFWYAVVTAVVIPGMMIVFALIRQRIGKPNIYLGIAAALNVFLELFRHINYFELSSFITVFRLLSDICFIVFAVLMFCGISNLPVRIVGIAGCGILALMSVYWACFDVYYVFCYSDAVNLIDFVADMSYVMIYVSFALVLLTKLKTPARIPSNLPPEEALNRLAALRASGELSESEYAAMRMKVISKI